MIDIQMTNHFYQCLGELVEYIFLLNTFGHGPFERLDRNVFESGSTDRYLNPVMTPHHLVALHSTYSAQEQKGLRSVVASFPDPVKSCRQT